MEGDGTQGNGHLVCKWWDPESNADEFWAVGRKPRIFPGSYTLRNITLALLVPKHRFQHQLTAEIYKPR